MADESALVILEGTAPIKPISDVPPSVSHPQNVIEGTAQYLTSEKTLIAPETQNPSHYGENVSFQNIVDPVAPSSSELLNDPKNPKPDEPQNKSLEKNLISSIGGDKHPSAETQIEDVTENTQKKSDGSCPGNPSAPVSGSRSGSSLDLGRFLFPGVSSVKASAAVSGSGPESSPVFPATAVEGSIPGGKSDNPLIIGKSHLVAPPVVPSGASGFVFPSSDLRDVVSRETWARFPEAVWKDAAVIVAEILKQANPGGSPVSQHPTPDSEVAGGSSSSSAFWEEAAKLAGRLEKGENLADGDISSALPKNQGTSNPISAASLETAHAPLMKETPVVNPPVPPPVKPATPVDPLNNGPDPKAPSFADLVSKESGSVESIGTTDFSGALPTTVFSKEECDIVSAVYKNALIGKFSFSKPDNFAIANSLFNAGFGKYTYARLWFKREFNVLRFPMRLFEWDPFFDFKQEPTLVPIWVKIKALPLQWFDLRPLKTIGSLMGTFLKADNLTLNRSRLDFARICVEINLKNSPPNTVGITCGTIFNEFEVEYAKLPSFCHHCHHLGHDIDACYIKNPSLKPQTFTNKFLTSENNKNKGKEKVEWFKVGKGKNVCDPSPSGLNNDEVVITPTLVTNVSMENAGDISGDEIVLVDNRFASLEAMGEEKFCPPPLVFGGNLQLKARLERSLLGKSLTIIWVPAQVRVRLTPDPRSMFLIYLVLMELRYRLIFNPMVGIRVARLPLKPIVDYIRIALKSE
ncbi:hypothetical protein OROGR_026609 [Orobanche gracilis]